MIPARPFPNYIDIQDFGTHITDRHDAAIKSAIAHIASADHAYLPRCLLIPVHMTLNELHAVPDNVDVVLGSHQVRIDGAGGLFTESGEMYPLKPFYEPHP